MTARRRRGASESEQAPTLISIGGASSSENLWTRDSDKKHVYNDYESNNGSLGIAVANSPDNTVQKMTSRDRTTEFVNAIRSLQGRNVARAVAVRDPKKAIYIQSYAEFMMIAR